VFSARQLEEIQKRLSSYPPILAGRRRTMHWTGELLSIYLDRKYGVSLGLRQCQRLLKQLGPRRNRSVSET
jgi:transposase